MQLDGMLYWAAGVSGVESKDSIGLYEYLHTKFTRLRMAGETDRMEYWAVGV